MKDLEKRQKGNVLFLILLAVALFAALSYAVTQATGSGGSNSSKENASLLAAELIQYASLVESAIQRIRLINSCKDTEISFQNDLEPAYDRTIDQRDACEVFHPDGGGVTFKYIPSEALDPTAVNVLWKSDMNHCVVNVGTHTDCSPETGDQGSETELLWAALNIKQDVCIAMNDRLGVVNPSGVPPVDGNSFSGGQFDGVYSPGSNVSLGDVAAELVGKLSACVQDTGGAHDGYYIFYHVLIPR